MSYTLPVENTHAQNNTTSQGRRNELARFKIYRVRKKGDRIPFQAATRAFLCHSHTLIKLSDNSAVIPVTFELLCP